MSDSESDSSDDDENNNNHNLNTNISPPILSLQVDEDGVVDDHSGTNGNDNGPSNGTCTGNGSMVPTVCPYNPYLDQHEVWSVTDEADVAALTACFEESIDR